MPQSSSSAAASNRLPRNFSVSAFPSITTYFLSSSLIFRSETRLAYRENTDQVDGFFLGVLARPALFFFVVIIHPLRLDPLSGQLFVFRSRRGDRVKLLFWDDDGFALFYKRLEMGCYRFPAAPADAVKPTIVTNKPMNGVLSISKYPFQRETFSPSRINRSGHTESNRDAAKYGDETELMPRFGWSVAEIRSFRRHRLAGVWFPFCL